MNWNYGLPIFKHCEIKSSYSFFWPTIKGPPCLRHPVPCWTLFRFFGLWPSMVQSCRGSNCADCTHWSSHKSLFHGPCNGSPASNLHSVALQIDTGSWGHGLGVLSLVSGGTGTGKCTLWPHTHPTDIQRCRFTAHLRPSWLSVKRSSKVQKGNLLYSKSARSSCAQWYTATMFSHGDPDIEAISSKP